MWVGRQHYKNALAHLILLGRLRYFKSLMNLWHRHIPIEATGAAKEKRGYSGQFRHKLQRGAGGERCFQFKNKKDSGEHGSQQETTIQAQKKKLVAERLGCFSATSLKLSAGFFQAAGISCG